MGTNTTDTPPPIHTPPHENHRWLQRLIGEWSYTVEAKMGPDAPAETFQGTERIRALGDLWILAEGEGQTPGGVHQSIMTLGFDPRTNRFVGTWIGSMMAHLWVYDGELSADGRTLPLLSEGPSMTGDGSLATYRDQIEIRSDTERVLNASVRGPDGTWQPFMTATYTRIG